MISVALASYNGEKYIKNQIISILDNLSNNDELIISDDGSTDSTCQIINSFNDSRIKLYKGPCKGINKNFENALSHCKGDIIFLSDQDDFWYPNKVNNIKRLFNESDYILIQHDARVINGEGEVLFESFGKMRNVHCGIIKNIIKNSYHGCLIAFKKELLKEVLPIPDKIYLHDEWIGLVAELNGKTFFSNKILTDYRRHENNASSFKHHRLSIMIKHRIQYILSLICYVVKRKKC